MTYSSPPRPDRAAPKPPSEVAVTTPRYFLPEREAKPDQIFTDWASI